MRVDERGMGVKLTCMKAEAIKMVFETTMLNLRPHPEREERRVQSQFTQLPEREHTLTFSHVELSSSSEERTTLEERDEVGGDRVDLGFGLAVLNFETVRSFEGGKSEGPSEESL